MAARPRNLNLDDGPGSAMAKKLSRVEERIRSIAAFQTGPVSFGRLRQTPRNAERQQTFRYGVIYVNSASQYPCIIKDMSADGVRVMLEGDIGLPPVVDFKAQTAPMRKRAAVVWQQEREVGLSFNIAEN